MTTKITTMWHCDAGGCTTTAPQDTDGWTDAIYTHACPTHGTLIKAHQAKVTCQTRGRGRAEKTTWWLRCACGWTPQREWETHTSRRLEDQHLAHVRQETAAGSQP